MTIKISRRFSMLRLFWRGRLNAFHLRRLIIPLPALLAAAAGSAQGAEHRLEMVVFQRSLQTAQTVVQYSPAALALIPARFNSLGVLTEPETEALPVQTFSTAPLQKLSHAASRLQNQDGYRILYQAAWRQPLTNSPNAIPLRVRGLERAPGVYELDGVLTISRDRFLHADIDLGFSELSLMPGLQATALSDAAEYSIQATDSEIANAAQKSAHRLLESEALELHQEGSGQWQATSSYRITTRSKLESGEINYLDHPYLGVLLYVEPVNEN